MQLFDPQSANAKVIVLFTDGKTTAGPPPAPVAAAARAEGIILYCIGLIGSDGIDVSVLNDWATDPDASHVAVTPDAADPEDLFRDLAANLSKTGATDIVIDEVVNDDFQIASMSPPTKGTAEMQSSTALQWKIPELGVTANSTAVQAKHAVFVQIEHQCTQSNRNKDIPRCLAKDCLRTRNDQ